MKKMKSVSILMLSLLGLSLVWDSSGAAQERSRLFPETGKTVTGKFLAYWEKNGGLPQQGFPISDILWENSDTDGKHYAVQYFERAVFELHSENQPPNDVLLSLLGNFLYKQKYPAGALNQKPNNTPGSVMFKETGRRLGGRFLEYWQKNGGLPQQGFPISDEFQEKSDLDGKTYTVQYFERAVFEMHPENQPPFDVLLSQLGTFRHRQKYSTGGGTPAPVGGTPTLLPIPPTVTPTPAPQGDKVLMIGSFDRQPNGYHATGQASIVRQSDGSHVVKLDIKEMTPGPDLFVWVTEHADPKNADQMQQGGNEISTLKETSGMLTYRLASSIDATKIKSVVIYCRGARAIFSVAKLQAP